MLNLLFDALSKWHDRHLWRISCSFLLTEFWYFVDTSSTLSKSPFVLADFTICTIIGVNSPSRAKKIVLKYLELHFELLITYFHEFSITIFHELLLLTDCFVESNDQTNNNCFVWWTIHNNSKLWIGSVEQHNFTVVNEAKQDY